MILTHDDSYQVSSVKSNKKYSSHVTVRVDNHPVRFQVDSGADVNIMDEKTFSYIKSRVKLSKCKARLYAFGSRSPLRLLGKFTATLAEFILDDGFPSKTGNSSKTRNSSKTTNSSKTRNSSRYKVGKRQVFRLNFSV